MDIYTYISIYYLNLQPFIQVAVLANHQNGRDTHIRQIKIYTPRRLMGQHMNLPEFSTVAFQQFACLR